MPSGSKIRSPGGRKRCTRLPVTRSVSTWPSRPARNSMQKMCASRCGRRPTARRCVRGRCRSQLSRGSTLPADQREARASSSTSPMYGAISFRYSRAISRRRPGSTAFLNACSRSALAGAHVGQLLADGHEIARPLQRVAADVLEDVLFAGRWAVGQTCGRPRKPRPDWSAAAPGRPGCAPSPCGCC